MRKIIKKARFAVRKSSDIIKAEGASAFVERSSKYVYYKKFPDRKKKVSKDILFINGCTLPHPTRYRVYHQMEQLSASGLSVDTVFYDQLDIKMLKYYRGFVFFRCPVTDTVKDFIQLAKQYNKTCFFDIDDLVIDQKYTDQIKYVKNMPTADKRLYDDGVNRMRETLTMCDYAITTTDRLQAELKSYTQEVFVNRNVASEEMVRYSIESLAKLKKDGNKFVIGYFSGSITHNEDFELVLPSLVRLLKEHKNLYLKIAGILDVPTELQQYQERIINVDFMGWRSMPSEIASCDINIAPLTSTIFNEAKSENKWTEASLAKVVTVASDIGAFKVAIKDKETGFLVSDDKWYSVLNELIQNKEKRDAVAQKAYKEVLENNTTIKTSGKLAEFIRIKLSRNIAFVLPSTDISGGVNVVLKHAEILHKNGWDVTLIDNIEKKVLKKSQKQYDYRLELPGQNVITKCQTKVESYFDTIVATLWSTVEGIKEYPNTTNRLYFVQNLETDFYVWGAAGPKILANATYSDISGIKYITMSLWCKKWLKQRFNKDSKYASNGIDLENYKYRERSFDKKVKVLIEGDSKSEYKNTDEAFRIVEKLDPAKYEISYLSYRKEPKSWYRVDHFYNRIAPEKVGEVYAKCDILIKTSLLESFSYPPLEMMATGGLSVVVPNDGNIEYLRDGENCLFYEQGNIDEGASKVVELVNNKSLRDKLIEGGLKTAKEYQWQSKEKDILKLYK